MVVRWEITHHMMMVFEIDTDAVEEVLPEELDPVEVVPGISLLNVATLNYAPGNFGSGSAPFSEIVAVIATHPDLTLRMPVPRFTFYDLSIFSDSIDFVEGERRTISTPTELSPGLQVEFRHDGLEAKVSDASGPICLFRNSSPEPPTYRPTYIWGQHYNDTRGFLVVGPWQWEGEMWEHQKQGTWGELYPHPFFKGLDISAVRRCYMQLFARPNALAIERFYEIKIPGGDKVPCGV